MNRFLPSLRVALILSLVIGAPLSAQEPAVEGEVIPDAWYQTIKAYRAVLSSEISNLTLPKEAATLVFKSGWIDVMEPVDGRHHTAVFRGDGVFILTPPTTIEQAQLEKFTGKKTLEEPFQSAVLRFTDDTVKEIQETVRLEPTLRDMGAAGEELCSQRMKKARENFQVNL
ncbi:hypothetical protein ACFLU6_15745, partial [Acidobacteriota bacterium]